MLPIFTNLLKLAGEIGILDAISDGRLDAGFASCRTNFAVRPLPNESVPRFRDGVEQIELRLTLRRARNQAAAFRLAASRASTSATV